MAEATGALRQRGVAPALAAQASHVESGAATAELVTPSDSEAVLAEARAAEEADALEEMARLRSEVIGDAQLEQPALQLALRIGAKTGDVALATTALALGANPAPRPLDKLRGGSVANEHGLPPLHLAAREGHVALVALLLDAKAPTTLLSTAGMPPLVVAAQSDRSLAALDLLLVRGAPLHMRDDRRQTALHTAARTGAVRSLRRLLVAAAEVDAASQALQRANSNKETTVELRDRWHRTALHWAVINQQAESVQVLIEAGANVNGVHVPRRKHNRATSLPHETPLHSAARLPPDTAAPLIRQLLRAKADPNRRDQFGQTPLHAAVASALLPCDAEFECVEEGPCCVAAPLGRTRGSSVTAGLAVEALLEGGADKEEKDANGRTAHDVVLQEQQGSGAHALVAALTEIRFTGAHPCACAEASS